MKKTMLLFFSLTLLTFSANTLMAQPPGGGRGGQMMNPEQRAARQAAMMQDSLSLTDDLKAEVEAVLLVYAKKMRESWANADGDREAMRSDMQNLRKEQDEELKAMIGEEKWTKWEAVRAEMRQGRPGRGGRQGQGPQKGKKRDTRTE